MPRLHHILIKSARLTLPTEDGDLHVEYYPKRVSQALIAHTQELDASARANAANNEKQLPIFLEMNEIFVSLVKEWDMLDEKPCGTCEQCKAQQSDACTAKIEFMFELEPNNLLRLPIEVISDVMTAIFENSSPNQTAPQKMNSSH